jgi:hypothetical protein
LIETDVLGWQNGTALGFVNAKISAVLAQPKNRDSATQDCLFRQ